MLNPKTLKALPFSFRGLSSLLYRDFTVYNNETLKKNFESRLKEKYFTKYKEQQELNKEEESFHDNIHAEIKKAFEETFDEIEEEEESILKSYKKQVYDQGDLEYQQRISRDAKFAAEAESHFKGISTADFLNRSKNLLNATRNKQAWQPKQKAISDEYLEYDKYRKNYANLRQVVQNDQEATEEFSLGDNVKKFMCNLDDSMQEKKMINQLSDEVGEGERDPAKLKEIIEQEWEDEEYDPREQEEFENDKGEMNFGQTDNDPVEDKVFGRVSPWAREEIYKLYKEGWNVRDLSLRFGLLPERVKAILWNRQHFYEEVLPNTPMETIKMGLEREMLYAMFYPWVDYGKDLEFMAERDRGVFFQRFRKTELDANPPKEVKNKMNKILEKQTRKKYDIVTENFVGHGEKGFFLKSWIVNKGHGSERVNKKFKMAVEFDQQPQLMPEKVRSKLKKGPRVASFGYGIE